MRNTINGWTAHRVGTTKAQRDRGYTQAWTLVHESGEYMPGESVTTREGALRIARNLPANPAAATRRVSAANREWANDIVAASRARRRARAMAAA